MANANCSACGTEVTWTASCGARLSDQRCPHCGGQLVGKTAGLASRSRGRHYETCVLCGRRGLRLKHPSLSWRPKWHGDDALRPPGEPVCGFHEPVTPCLLAGEDHAPGGFTVAGSVPCLKCNETVARLYRCARCERARISFDAPAQRCAPCSSAEGWRAWGPGPARPADCICRGESDPFKPCPAPHQPGLRVVIDRGPDELGRYTHVREWYDASRGRMCGQVFHAELPDVLLEPVPLDQVERYWPRPELQAQLDELCRRE